MGLGYSLYAASLRSADPAVAKEMATEAHGLLRRVGHPMGIAHGAEGRGIIAFESGELGGAADELRRQSGQGHRPWEIRARLGNLQDRIIAPGTPAPARRDYSLPEAASMAVRALRSVMTSTAS